MKLKEEIDVLVICDYFSKWVEAFAIPNQTAQVVANALEDEVICMV